MRITWLTEGNWTGRIPRDHRNMRNDAAWMCVLDADHQPLFGQWNNKKYDLAIITLPKKNFEHLVQNNVEIVDLVRQKLATKVAVIQEGPHEYFTDYKVNEQIWFLNQLSATDFLLCHNKYDKIYYEGLFPNKSVHILITLMIDDQINDLPKVERENVIIGGNFCSWYNGTISFLVASELEIPIFAPSMGRRVPNEEQVGINHLPYMDWLDWMRKLNEFRYAVHLMPVVAAGTFSINCAKIGLPCISNEKIDTQRLCFPELSIDINDIGKAKKLLLRLRDDQSFYDYCSERAQKHYLMNYSEEVFMIKFKEIVKNESI